MSALVRGDRNKSHEKKGNDVPERSAQAWMTGGNEGRHLSDRVWRRQSISETQKCNGNGGFRN